MLVRHEVAIQPGQMSVTEDKTTKFTNALTGVYGGTTGILRDKTRTINGRGGRPNKPYAHQRKCAKRALPDDQKRMLICHDPGLGKTFTFLLIVAGMHTLKKGVRRKTLVSAPASVLEQWKTACLDTLRIPEKNILMTNKLDKITPASLAKHDMIIVSRDLIGRAFSKCHEWVSRHHQNERGNWMSQWDAKPGVVEHCIFSVVFDLVGYDECHCASFP
jgi:superfamily II DNA or RNA helicase